VSITNGKAGTVSATCIVAREIDTPKSGCRAENSKLRTAERLVNLIAVFCIVSWRVF
jgi:hypothetical protein